MKKMFFDIQYIAPEVPPREDTRPTRPCRPGPPTRRRRLKTLSIGLFVLVMLAGYQSGALERDHGAPLAITSAAQVKFETVKLAPADSPITLELAYGKGRPWPEWVLGLG